MEYKSEIQVSKLDAAIYLLREAVDRRPTSHLNCLDLLSDLAAAQVAKFWHGGQSQDLDKAFFMRTEALKRYTDSLTTTRDDGSQFVRPSKLRPSL